MNKELVIKCTINKNSQEVAIVKTGFESNSVEDALTIIGVLESVKNMELERLRTSQKSELDFKKIKSEKGDDR